MSSVSSTSTSSSSPLPPLSYLPTPPSLPSPTTASVAGPSDVQIIDREDDPAELIILSSTTRPSRKPPRSKPTIIDLTTELSPAERQGSPPAIFKPSGSTATPPRVAIKCAICLNPLSHPASTVCGHLFCESCIRLAVRTTKTCPTCRRKLARKDIHRIYL